MHEAPTDSCWEAFKTEYCLLLQRLIGLELESESEGSRRLVLIAVPPRHRFMSVSPLADSRCRLPLVCVYISSHGGVNSSPREFAQICKGLIPMKIHGLLGLATITARRHHAQERQVWSGS